MKRIFTVILAVMMLFGAVACGKNEYAHGSQKTVMKIGDTNVTEEVYRYFLLNTVDQLAGDDAGYFTGDKREERLEELDKLVLENLVQYYSVFDLADKLKIKLTNSELEELDVAMEQLRESYETEEEYKNDLKNAYLSEYMAYRMFYYEFLQSALYETASETGKYFSTDGNDILAYAKQNFLFCRQIVVESDSPISDHEGREKAEQIRERLLAGEDAADILDDYKEDSVVLGAYYCFADGEDFSALDEETVAKMKPGEISEVRMDGYGFHIIIRLSADEAYLKENLSGGVFESYCMHQLNLLLTQIQEAYTVEYVDKKSPEEYR